MRVKIKTLKCKRCGHEWIPNKPEVIRCSRCKSPYWHRERIQRKGKSIR